MNCRNYVIKKPFMKKKFDGTGPVPSVMTGQEHTSLQLQGESADHSAPIWLKSVLFIRDVVPR